MMLVTPYATNGISWPMKLLDLRYLNQQYLKLKEKKFPSKTMLWNLLIFPQDNSVLPCSYEGCDFTDKDDQNIVTGHLPIIQNINLRKLFTKSVNKKDNNIS